MISGNNDDAWGLKRILDLTEDVAVFVVSELDDKLLYCNYLVTLRTGKHEGSSFKGMWEEVRKHMGECGEGRTLRYVERSTPFGKNKNVTITRTVWHGSIKAYSFTITPHIENEEEKEQEAIFKALGRSYLSVGIIDIESDTIKTIFMSGGNSSWYGRPIPFELYKANFIYSNVYKPDVERVSSFLDSAAIQRAVNEGKKNLKVQYRRFTNGESRWTEYQISILSSEDNHQFIVFTEKDIHGNYAINEDQKINQMIMESLANSYRSVYLLNLESGEYSTVKPDELLFGIPGEGDYDNLMTIVAELIPDEKQKKDLLEYFDIKALKKNFDEGSHNIGREYNSNLSEGMSWMNISAFRPPFMQGLEDACILTFMDITEHKRVERERDETNLAIEILAEKYLAVFFFKRSDFSFHAIRLAQKYKYLEKQFDNLNDAFGHYVSAYVLDEYRDVLKKNLDEVVNSTDRKEECSREVVYRNVEGIWIRLIIRGVPNGDDSEFIMAFEDYDVFMKNNVSGDKQ